MRFLCTAESAPEEQQRAQDVLSFRVEEDVVREKAVKTMNVNLPRVTRGGSLL